MSAVRPARPGDEAALRQIWKVCFGDDDAYIDGFFTALYRPENALVLTGETADAVGMAHLLPLGTLVDGTGTAQGPCAVTYALAVLPAYRGRGGGGALAAAAAALARVRGAVPLICPAEPSLFAYYADRTDYVTAFFAAEKRFPACPGRTETLGADEYLRRRETLLAGRAHIAFSAPVMAYEASLCRRSGGGLFAVPGGVAAMESGMLKELLVPAGAEGAAAGAVASALGLPSVRARYPSAETPFAMAARGAVSGAAWFGFAFD